MNFGLPYKGSKNKIAKWVCDILPNANTLYDLFCVAEKEKKCNLSATNNGKITIERIFRPRTQL